MRIGGAPHLQTKKITKADKLRADELMIECLVLLAHEHNLRIDPQVAERLAKDPRTRRSAGYYTYAHWLILRLAGESDGPSILALWRIIAWDPRGGMRPDFEFRIEDIQAAEATLLGVLRKEQ
jgi:hypothetical protein